MLLVHNKESESVPAQLEINSNSFAPLKKMLEPIEEDNLSTLLVVLEIKKQDKYLQIQFKPVF
jgi:hypothetical protein